MSSEPKKIEVTVEELDVLVAFLREVCTDTAIRDHEYMEELQWYDMSVGFFLARGMSVDQAANLARIARYDLQYDYALAEKAMGRSPS